MKLKKSIQHSKEEGLVTVYELLEKDGRIYGVGNSKEVSKQEAILLIQERKAKTACSPVGEMPASWQFGDVAGDVGNGGSDN